jgi:hypothetical protein
MTSESRKPSYRYLALSGQYSRTKAIYIALRSVQDVDLLILSLSYMPLSVKWYVTDSAALQMITCLHT